MSEFTDTAGLPDVLNDLDQWEAYLASIEAVQDAARDLNAAIDAHNAAPTDETVTKVLALEAVYHRAVASALPFPGSQSFH